MPYLVYYTFQDYITANLCEQRNTEKFALCNGTCQLNEMVKTTQGESKNDILALLFHSLSFSDVHIIKEANPTQCYNIAVNDVVLNPSFSSHYKSTFVIDFFIPPQNVA